MYNRVQREMLVMDRRSELKQHSLPGLAWDVFTQPLLPALSALQQCPGVLRGGLTADHLRAITQSEVDPQTIREFLLASEIQFERLERVEPTLEDIFLALVDVKSTPPAEPSR